MADQIRASRPQPTKLAASKASPPVHSQRQWSTLWPFALLAVLAVIFHWRLIFSSASQIIATDDITLYFLWMHQFVRDSLLEGRLPLWNPYNYCGSPFAANPQAAVFYPLAWLHLLMPVISAQKLSIALHSFLAGSFMLLYLRRIGVGLEASLVACLPWMFGNYFGANAAVGHLTMIFTATWLPLALYCLERAIQSRRVYWLFWTGIVLGVQVLAGEPQNSYYTALLVAFYGLVRIVFEPPLKGHAWDLRRYGRWAWNLALIGVIAACAGAIQLLPTAEFAQVSDRAANTYEFATFVSVPPASLLEFILPWSTQAIWGLGIEQPRMMLQQNWEFAGYAGLFTLILAGLSMRVRGQPALLAARVAVVVGLILLLGRFTPLYEPLFRWMPGLSLFRIPARIMIIVHWAICVMAAFGFQRLIETGEQRWRWGWWKPIATVSLLALLAATMLIFVFADVRTLIVPDGINVEFGESIGLGDPSVIRLLAALAATAALVIGLRWMKRSIAIASMALLIALDLWFARPTVPLGKYSTAGDTSLAILDDIKQRSSSGVQSCRADFAPSLMVANTAMASRVDCVNGYSPLVLERFFQFVHAMRGYELSQQSRHELPDRIYHAAEPFPLRLLNVRFGARWNRAEKKYEFAEDPNPMPRAWIVDSAEVIPDAATALKRLKAANFDPARTVLLEQPPRLALRSGDEPIPRPLVKRKSERQLEILTDSTRDGYLILSEVFYPGWVARIDGQRAELERADYLLTAMPLPAGTHRISYRYEPEAFTLGAAITAATFLTAGSLCAFMLMQRKSQKTGAVK